MLAPRRRLVPRPQLLRQGSERQDTWLSDGVETVATRPRKRARCDGARENPAPRLRQETESLRRTARWRAARKEHGQFRSARSPCSPGAIADRSARAAAHNDGLSNDTKKFKPWRVVTDLAFSDEDKAVAFERCLKPASGRAFAKKRLLERNVVRLNRLP
jgi:predicted GIY-YIG superfamily endonuclease